MLPKQIIDPPLCKSLVIADSQIRKNLQIYRFSDLRFSFLFRCV